MYGLGVTGGAQWQEDTDKESYNKEKKNMPNIQGTVVSCSYKNVPVKKGPKAGSNAQIWSFKLDDEKWYGCGFTKPARPDKVRLLAGDKVKFSFNEDQYGRQVVMDTLQVKAIAVPTGDEENEQPSAPAKRSFGGGKSFGGGGNKDDYWQKKEEFDKKVTQPLIMRQAANNVASTLVAAALDKDILPLPAKKADKWEALMLCYEQVRNEIFTQMMTDYSALQQGGSIIPISNVTDEEDSNGFSDLEDMELLNANTSSREDDWAGMEDDDWGDK